MYANKNIRWFIKYFMQCRVFYAVKGCFNLLRMRSKVSFAPSAHATSYKGRGSCIEWQHTWHTRPLQQAPKVLNNSVSATCRGRAWGG